jgi:putative FmdB family regulatory protein
MVDPVTKVVLGIIGGDPPAPGARAGPCPVARVPGARMPTYEYACTECGQHVEVVQSMSAAPLTTCAVCGGRLRKVFSPIGVVFKGSGFYRTDSRAKTGASEGSRSGTSKGGASGSSSESSGSKAREKGSKADGSSSKPSEKSA